MYKLYIIYPCLSLYLFKQMIDAFFEYKEYLFSQLSNVFLILFLLFDKV
jgi:hypothetical protein